MTELRKQFEALPEIERHVKNGFIEFIGNHYFLPEHVKNDGSQAFLIHKHNVTWVNGAWWAFQEQQKKIDDFVNIIHDAYMSNGNSSVEIVYDKIQELLK